MPVLLSARITSELPPGRRLNEVIRAAHRAGGEHWGEAYLRIHFTRPAAARYGYRPRQPQTTRRKLRKGSQPVHLVDSGATGQAALASVPRGIRAYPTRLTITLNLPAYVPQRPRDARRPDMAGEIAAVIPAEQREIERAMQHEADRQLTRMQETQRVTVL